MTTVHRSLIVPALLAGLVAAAAPSSGAEGVASLRLEDVFPPGRSVCAVPSSGARPGVAGVASREGDRLAGSAGVPPPEILAEAVPRDRARGAPGLHVLRWSGVEARPLSEEIPLHVRARSVGLTIRAEAPTDDWRISVELLSAGGELLACEDCDTAPAVGEVREGRGTTQMPSTDRPGWELTPGHYRFRVRATPVEERAPSFGGTTVDVVATLRSDAPVHLDRFLDLNFVYTPNCSLSTAIATTSPLFGEFLARVDRWLAPAGIRVGRVTHVDLDRPEFDLIATWAEAGDMFRTSAEVGRYRTLNVYCVQGFEPPLNPVVGLSGGIPGPLANGTRDSGIAIRTSPFLRCGANCLDAFASLMAHEIGHYLGFYHTTSADLTEYDPFSDTPECTGDAIGSHCPDYGYVMFPLIHTGNIVWSTGQARVVPTHPLVHTVPVAGPPVASGRPEDAPPLAFGPNPFGDEIRFVAPETSGGGISLHDVAGRLVRRLAGSSETFVWDGRTDDGGVAPAGVYFARWERPDGRPVTFRVVKSR